MRSKRKISLKPVTGALVLAATAFTGAIGGSALATAESRSAPQLQAPAAAAVTQAGDHSSLADMVEAVGPSVVQIDASRGARLVQTPFGVARTPGGQAVGSGFIIAPSGLVITNNHVIDGADQVKLKLSDGSECSATVLGRDAKTDIAVLRIEGGGKFQPIRWGDSDAARVGDSVFAMGSPFGLGNSVTAGILSARSREIGAGPYDDFLQVDAPINSGNSGGPLFDAFGRVIGVNTAIASPTGGSVGIGFAIPSRMAQNIARQIVARGEVSRGYAGVGLQEVTPTIAEALGLDSPAGAFIARVEPGSPAAAAGLSSGDVVRSFGGKRIDDARDFARYVAESRAGNSVPLTIVRNGRRLELTLRIGAARG